jgi:phospholipase/carboxylesterase
MSGEQRTVLPPHELATAARLVEARFIPQRYEPNYAYPLLVMFHGRGGDEHQLLRTMPDLSWRNYVAVSLRGPEETARRSDEAEEGFGWGGSFSRRERRGVRPPLPPTEILRRSLHGPFDAVDVVEEGVFHAVRQARSSLHIHSERIFLVGCGEGAAVAYLLGLTYPERFAGVVAINGWIPTHFRPLGRLKAARDLRILVVHGEWNSRSPIERVRRDVNALRSGGLRVAFQSYPCANRLTAPMLSDVDTWLINQCTADLP